MPVPNALPLQTRLAPLGAIDVEARTIDLVWTTGATVRRRRYVGWDTAVPFDEELVVSDAAVDLTRLKAGAPVLDSHMSYSTDYQRAVVDDAWIKGGEGEGRIRFPEEGTDPASDRLFKLARQKIVRNISVGYSIDKVRVVEPQKAGDVERRIIERWTPYELSFVTVPADAGAQIRAGDVRNFPVEIIGRAIEGAPPVLSATRAAAIRARMAMAARMAGL